MQKDLLHAIGELLDSKLEVILESKLETILESKLDAVLDAKLEIIFESKLGPIYNELNRISSDLNSLKVHVGSINNRLFILEERMAKVDSKIDTILHAS